MRAFFYRILFFFGGLFWVIACGDRPTCLDRDTNYVKVKFIDDEGADKSITLTGLRAIDNEDGFPEYTDTALSLLQLPLNPGARTSVFLLDQSTGTDTIGLSYDVVAQLISPECGMDAAYSNLDTTRITFPKAEILSTIINQEIVTNIEITH